MSVTAVHGKLNLIVVAMERALKLNLAIHQKGLSGNRQILDHTTHATAKEAHWKFTCDPSDVANNHYEAILLLNKPTESHTEEEVTIGSPCLSTFEQATSLDDADDVTDLTDDYDMTSQESHFKITQEIMSCSSLLTYLSTQQ